MDLWFVDRRDVVLGEDVADDVFDGVMASSEPALLCPAGACARMLGGERSVASASPVARDDLETKSHFYRVLKPCI